MGCIGQAADSFAPFGGSRRSVVFVCRAPCRCRAPCLPLSLFQGNPFTISPQYLPQAQDSYQNAHFCSFSSPFFFCLRVTVDATTLAQIRSLGIDHFNALREEHHHAPVHTIQDSVTTGHLLATNSICKIWLLGATTMTG